MTVRQALWISLLTRCCYYPANAFHGPASLRIRPLLQPTQASTTAMDQEKDIASLPLPPHRKPGPFRNLRDTLSHIVNPHQFTLRRAKELGPVFLTHQFFQPTVVVGGQAAVKEFISGTELTSQVVYSALPETFQTLHTKWGALNLDANDVLFKQARNLFADCLQSQDALNHYTATIDTELNKYIADLEKRIDENPNEPVYLVPELMSLCLQIFSILFSGQGLTKQEEQMFLDYNEALLSLSNKTKGYHKGLDALEQLKEVMTKRFHALDATAGQLDQNPGQFYHDLLVGREGYEGNDDRIASAAVLFIWGAYVECAALMINAMVTSRQQEGVLGRVLEEYQTRQESSSLHESDYKFWSGMPYTLGVLRESLRIIPPGGGTSRYSPMDFELCGYRVPAKTAVMLDPRIGNSDPTLFASPEEFEPLRWVPKSAETETSGCPFRGTALQRGPGSWFPGGFGAHQCPGLPLAELVGRMFLAKMASKFDSWEFSGSGLTRKGEVKFVEIPIKHPVKNFGLILKK